MDKQLLIDKLSRNFLSSKMNKKLLTDHFLASKKDIQILINIINDSDENKAFLAAWILDGIARQNIDTIQFYIPQLISILESTENESVLRSTSKIFELIALDYKKDKRKYQSILDHNFKEQLIEIGFDKLISNHKVAVKVLMMEVLLEFGKETDWVHLELKSIIEKELFNGSPAYQARGKKTLKAINKIQL